MNTLMWSDEWEDARQPANIVYCCQPAVGQVLTRSATVGARFVDPKWLRAHHLLSPEIKLGIRRPRKKRKKVGSRMYSQSHLG